MLFHETLMNINEKETNNALVLFFSFIISSRQLQSVIEKYLDYIVAALICSIPKETGPLHEKLTNALVTLMNQAEQHNFTDHLKKLMLNTLESK